MRDAYDFTANLTELNIFASQISPLGLAKRNGVSTQAFSGGSTQLRQAEGMSAEPGLPVAPTAGVCPHVACSGGI